MIHMILSLFLLTGETQQEQPKKQPPLPPHTVVSDRPLGTKGRRIEIRVSKVKITKQQCLAILRHYLKQAEPNGQVGVQIPHPRDRTFYAPWCVDNLDGKGPFFNDAIFEEIK